MAWGKRYIDATSVKISIEHFSSVVNLGSWIALKTSFKITLLGLIQPVSMRGVEMHYLEGPDYGRFTFLRVSMKEEKPVWGWF